MKENFKAFFKNIKFHLSYFGGTTLFEWTNSTRNDFNYILQDENFTVMLGSIPTESIANKLIPLAQSKNKRLTIVQCVEQFELETSIAYQWDKNINIIHCPMEDYKGHETNTNQLALKIQEAQNAIQNGDVVYIHCKAGKSRSAGFTENLLNIFGFTFIEAYQQMKLHREQVDLKFYSSKKLQALLETLYLLEGTTGIEYALSDLKLNQTILESLNTYLSKKAISPEEITLQEKTNFKQALTKIGKKIYDKMQEVPGVSKDTLHQVKKYGQEKKDSNKQYDPTKYKFFNTIYQLAIDGKLTAIELSDLLKQNQPLFPYIFYTSIGEQSSSKAAKLIKQLFEDLGFSFTQEELSEIVNFNYGDSRRPIKTLSYLTHTLDERFLEDGQPKNYWQINHELKGLFKLNENNKNISLTATEALINELSKDPMYFQENLEKYFEIVSDYFPKYLEHFQQEVMEAKQKFYENERKKSYQNFGFWKDDDEFEKQENLKSGNEYNFF